jgi:hypothetical protein
VKAYENAFTGGVRVAAADVNRDTYPDVVVAPGPGGGPRVRVLDGKTGEQIAGPLGNFFAFEEDFTGGLSVAGADVNGDGVPDVVVAAGQGGGPRVRVFSGADGTVLADFYAFEADFRGGMTVAAADITGDDRAELVVGAGPGSGPRVRVLDVIAIDETATARERTLNATDGAATARERSKPATAPLPSRRQDPTPVPGALGDFFAFPADLRTGVTVGTDWKAGDVTGDGVPDLLVGSGPGAAPTVRVYSGADGTLVSQFPVFDPTTTAGVRGTISGQSSREGAGEPLTSTANIFWSGGPVVGIYRASPGKSVDNFFVDREVNVVLIQLKANGFAGKIVQVDAPNGNELRT